MTLASTLHELVVLVGSYHPLIVIETSEEDRARRLAMAASHRLAISLFEWSISRGLHFASDHTRGGNPIATTQTPEGVLQHLLAMDRDGMFWLKDFSTHLETPLVARLLREVCQAFEQRGSAVLLTGTNVTLTPELEHHAVHLPLALPTERELESAIDGALDSLAERPKVEVALDPKDRAALLEAVRGLTLNQARQAVTYVALQDNKLAADDVATVVDRKARWIQDDGILEYYPAGDNAFEIGGFERLKEWLERAREGYSERARALNLAPPKGLLLAGVQGCGKSLAAKAIARAWQQPLLKLDAGRLYDKYIGETEKNLRRALQLAEGLAPAVLWIDEIEKAFGSSSSGDDANDGGLSRRVQGHLLTWLQEKSAPVFVVATANDVFALPPELMRRGRFDEVFFVDLPKSPERRSIFEIHLRLREQDPQGHQLDDLVLASDGMSGAEIEQAVIAALYRSLHERQPLTDAHLLRELDGTVPLAVSRREDIDRLRSLAAERFVPVGR
ncbi:MAG: AAA family ATPase [Myxococcota bacterium]